MLKCPNSCPIFWRCNNFRSVFMSSYWEFRSEMECRRFLRFPGLCDWLHEWYCGTRRMVLDLRECTPIKTELFSNSHSAARRAANDGCSHHFFLWWENAAYSIHTGWPIRSLSLGRLSWYSYILDPRRACLYYLEEEWVHVRFREGGYDLYISSEYDVSSVGEEEKFAVRHVRAAFTDWQVKSESSQVLSCSMAKPSDQVWIHILVFLSIATPGKRSTLFAFVEMPQADVVH